MTTPSRSFEHSPKTYARIAGIIYLVIIVAGFAGELLIRNKIIVDGDPAATANNIIAAPALWRIGITGDLLMHICDLPAMLILYLLLKRVNKNLALLNLLFNIIQTAVLVANKLNLLMPLFLLSNVNYLSSFDQPQLQALSYLFIKLHNYGFGVGLIFFGFVCLIEGYLIVRAKFLPAFLGRMMQVAGVCYLTNSFLLLLYPEASSVVIVLPCPVAESSLALWLTIKGIDESKWPVIS